MSKDDWEQIKAKHKGFHGPEITRRTDAELEMDRLTQIPAGNYYLLGAERHETPSEATDETAEERCIRSSQRQAKEQVPAGDAAALTEYMANHPWLTPIAPPKPDRPQSRAEIEAENQLRLRYASGRTATHGGAVGEGGTGAPWAE